MQYDELVSGIIPLSASNVGSGFTRSVVASKANSLPTQTMCALDADLTRLIDVKPIAQVEVDGTQLEFVNRFGYL